jgi:hypothetical protein
VTGVQTCALPISDSPLFPSYDVRYGDVAFIIVIVNFYNMETIRFSLTC